MTLLIKNLSKKFGQNQVLTNVSLGVEAGEIVGLFGENGAGKTVLIETIAGNYNADGGSISLGGEDLTDDDRRKNSFVLFSAQNDSAKSASPSGENFDSLSNGARQTAEFEKILESGDGGAVLLLDNPFCFMDARSCEKNSAKLRDFAKTNRVAVVFATIDFSQIFSVCDRVAVLSGGAVEQIGTPPDVYAHPQMVTVAAATGRNNLIAARRVHSAENETPEFATISGGHRLFTDRRETGKFDGINQNVTLAIRPEHISISFGASFPEDNLLRARIAGVSYAGATTLIELDAEGLRLQALVLRLVGLKIGDECVVGLPPNRILVLEN